MAILVEAATDNKNRTAADVRAIFTKAGGQLAGAGAVAWQFEPRGVIAVARDGQDPDEVALLAIDAGADDVDTETDPIEVMTDAGEPRGGAQGARGRRRGHRVGRGDHAGQDARSRSTSTHARQNLRLIETLEDHDDVQRVTANFDLPDEVLAELTA